MTNSSLFLSPCQYMRVFTAYYRFVVLFFNCMLTFGSYFCFDIPSVLQEQFQGVRSNLLTSDLWPHISLDILKVVILRNVTAFTYTTEHLLKMSCLIFILPDCQWNLLCEQNVSKVRSWMRKLCFLLQNLTCPNATVSNSTGNGTGVCVEGLGMTPQEYNLLYAIYAWTWDSHTHTTRIKLLSVTL